MTQPTLFDGAARTKDPDTSRGAARAQRGGAYKPILDAFLAHGPMTDDELADRLAPEWNPGTVKSARSRLKNAGALVDTGDRKPSAATGSPSIVWARPTDVVTDVQGRVA